MTPHRPSDECWKCHARGLPIELIQLFKGTLFWQCTECQNRWHEHTEGTAGHEIADPFVQRGKRRT